MLVAMETHTVTQFLDAISVDDELAMIHNNVFWFYDVDDGLPTTEGSVGRLYELFSEEQG